MTDPKELKKLIVQLLADAKKRSEYTKVLYWHQLRDDPPLLFSRLGAMNLLIHHSAELDQIMEFIGPLLVSRKVAYLSVTRTHKHIQEACNKHPGYLRNTTIVDFASSFLFNSAPPKDSHCIVADKPTSIRSLFTSIREFIAVNEVVIIDALTDYVGFTPNDFQNEKEFSQLISLQQDYLGRQDKKILFLFDSSVGAKVSIPTHRFDEIFELEVIKQQIDIK